jgi:hypothetical protein
MSREIWKFELSSAASLMMPEGGKILSVKRQYDSICLWVLVDPTAKPVSRFFEVHGTGRSLSNCSSLKFIDTVLIGDSLVLHAFERLSITKQEQES